MDMVEVCFCLGLLSVLWEKMGARHRGCVGGFGGCVDAVVTCSVVKRWFLAQRNSCTKDSHETITSSAYTEYQFE